MVKGSCILYARDMKELFLTFSPEISDDRVGDRLQASFVYPLKPEKVFDLHGYFEDEISGKMEYIFLFSEERKFSHIKIITGKGRKILFKKVLSLLRKKEENSEISGFSSDQGSFTIYLSR